MATTRRIRILTDGHLDVFTAKTAVGILRYCPDEVTCVLDRAQAGRDLEQIVGTGKGVPIVDSVDAAAHLGANQLLMGVALPGGRLPDAWRAIILQSLESGMDIVNGLHQRISQDEEIARRAGELGRVVHEVRVPPAQVKVGTARARQTRGKRILTIGTDCNLGKRVTALELVKAMRADGISVQFVATGQTGVMIEGSGVVVDAVVSDFVSGAVEAAILEKADAEYVVVEGQGALLHPSFSGVTLGLMHGTMPDYMILCHAPSRKVMRNTDYPLPSLREMIQLSESIMRPLYPSRVIGVSLNCHGMSDEEGARALEAAERETGLPVVDSLRTGVEALIDVLRRPPLY